jgi:Arc/MetJ family transcription regulator/predicted nucleic acid-binding protein
VTATQIDIDDEALAEAMRLSGAKTKKEMVNIALREYAQRRAHGSTDALLRAGPALGRGGLLAAPQHRKGRSSGGDEHGGRLIVIRYLADSTAVWRLQRERKLNDLWGHELDEGAVGSCAPQRTEFRQSARSLDEYDRMTDMFAALYPDISVPKAAWTWVEAGQYRLAQRSRHQSLSTVDWLLCATAAHHGLVVLHDDAAFRTAARLLADLTERNVYATPG